MKFQKISVEKNEIEQMKILMNLNLIKIIQLNLMKNIEVLDGIDTRKIKCSNGKNKEIKKIF